MSSGPVVYVALAVIFALILLFSACTGSKLSVEQITGQALPIPVASEPVDAFVGTWEGVYYSYPHPMGLTLSLTATGKTGVEGHVRFFPLDSSSRTLPRPAQGSFSVRGTYDPTLRTFDLSPDDWDERPTQGGRPFALAGVFDPRQPALAGLFAGQRLDHYFTLTRPEQARHLTGPMLGQPSQRTRSRVPGDDALVAWASRFNAEYPDVNPRRTQMGQLYTLAVNLFADEHFSAYFSNTFDQMSTRQRDAVLQRFARTTRLSRHRPGSFGALLQRAPASFSSAPATAESPRPAVNWSGSRWHRLRPGRANGHFRQVESGS